MRLAALLALTAIPLSASWSIQNPLSLNRTVTITAHTAPGARCTMTESIGGLRLHATASRTGRARFRWRPSIWADGAETVSIHCVKGRASASTETFLAIDKLPQVAVLRHYALHLVYWAPKHDMPASVPTTVARFEADVKASLDAGATDNPFAIPRAYRDSAGPDDPRIASIDSTVDTHPYPKPSGGVCRPAPPACLAAADVGGEMVRIARQHRWATGNHTLIVVFTPPSLVVCNDGPCTLQTEVCGYHAVTGAGYAYADVIMSGCLGSDSPSHYAVSLLGHEQNEALVDPLGFGLEVADKCEGDFRSIPINGHAYDLPAILLHGKCAFGLGG